MKSDKTARERLGEVCEGRTDQQAMWGLIVRPPLARPMNPVDVLGKRGYQAKPHQVNQFSPGAARPNQTKGERHCYDREGCLDLGGKDDDEKRMTARRFDSVFRREIPALSNTMC